MPSGLLSLLSLDEAEALHQILSYDPSSVPPNTQVILWTRRGVPLAISNGASNSRNVVAAPAALAVCRFFNADMWYNDSEVRFIAESFGLRPDAPAQQPGNVKVGQLLRALAAVRRRDNLNLTSSSLSGRVIPVE